MTLEEMNNVTLGFVNGDNGCVGKSGSVPRLDFPGLCLHDAGNGVRATDGVNAYASGISIGASWNASLAFQRARFMGREFRAKGVQVALGPVVGPIGRIATGGWCLIVSVFPREKFADCFQVATGKALQRILTLMESLVRSPFEGYRRA